MLILKLILLFLVLKVIWIILAFVAVAAFWGVILLIIAARSLRDRLNGNRPPFKV